MGASQFFHIDAAATSPSRAGGCSAIHSSSGAHQHDGEVHRSAGGGGDPHGSPLRHHGRTRRRGGFEVLRSTRRQASAQICAMTCGALAFYYLCTGCAERLDDLGWSRANPWICRPGRHLGCIRNGIAAAANAGGKAADRRQELTTAFTVQNRNSPLNRATIKKVRHLPP